MTTTDNDPPLDRGRIEQHHQGAAPVTTPKTPAAVSRALSAVEERRAALRQAETPGDVTSDVLTRLIAGEPWPADVADRLTTAEQHARELQLVDQLRTRLGNQLAALRS